MDANGMLLRLLHSLKEHNHPRDDSLLSRLLTALTDYCCNKGFRLPLASDGIFVSEHWLNTGPPVLSFVVQLAGICGGMYDESSEDFVKVETFLMEVMRSDSFSSVSCAWLKALKSIILKHKKKPLSDEIVSRVGECLVGAHGHFAGEAALSLAERLVENCRLDAEGISVHEGSVESLLSSLVLGFCEGPSDVATLRRVAALAEGIFRGDIGGMEILSAQRSTFCRGSIEPLLVAVRTIPSKGSSDIDRALDLLDWAATCAPSVTGDDIVLGLLRDLIAVDNEKDKALRAAAWMMKRPSYIRLTEALERLCLSPLLHELGRPASSSDPSAEDQLRFVDLSFSSEVLCEVFKIVSCHEFKEHEEVPDLCMEFLRRNCIDVALGSGRPAKCVRACLDGLHRLTLNGRKCLSKSHRLSMVEVLLAVQEDNLALTKALDLVSDLSKRRAEDDDDGRDFSSRLHAALHLMVESPTWDIRDGAIVLIGKMFAAGPPDTSGGGGGGDDDNGDGSRCRRMIEHGLDRVVWKTLEDEEPYVRASASGSLLRLLLACRRFRVRTFISVVQALEKALGMLTGDEEAFARRAACNFLTGYAVASTPELFPCLRSSIVGTSDAGIEPRDEGALPLFVGLASAATEDADWEVKVAALRFFRVVLCEMLFDRMVDRYFGSLDEATAPATTTTAAAAATTTTKASPVLRGEESEIVSTTLSALVMACDDHDSPAVEAALAALADLRGRFEEGATKKKSRADFEDFVCFFCSSSSRVNIRKADVLRAIRGGGGAGKENDDGGRGPDACDPAREVVSLLADVEACLVPPAAPGTAYEGWTSDEEEYLDFGKADCY